MDRAMKEQMACLSYSSYKNTNGDLLIIARTYIFLVLLR
jgi:hypothetical protein